MMDDVSFVIINILLIGGFFVAAYEVLRNHTTWAWISMLSTLAMLVVING